MFGKLKYDVENDSFNFSELLGMYRGDKLNDLVDTFKNKRFWDLMGIVGWSAVFGFTAWMGYELGKLLRNEL